MNVQSAEAIVAILAATGGFFFTLWRYVTRPAYRFFTRLYSSLNTIPALTSEVHFMRKELMPNGGTTIRDAIDRIEANQRLQEHTLDTLMAEHGIAFFRANVKGEFIMASSSMCKLFKRDRDDLLGGNLISCVCEEDRLDFEREWRAAITGSRNLEISIAFDIEHKPVILELRCGPVRSMKGQPIAFQGTISVPEA